MSDPTVDLPCAWGGQAGQGHLRTVPEDFVVEERPLVQPSGAGEHLLVRIRKRGLDTLEVARRLARVAGVAPRAVSFAGLKDRHAVTEQTFSIHLPGRPDPSRERLESIGVEVLEVCRHHRKLRRGALAGNRFRIRVRAFRGDGGRLEECLQAIGRHGVPNYFGSQRFGRHGVNLERARALLAGDLRRVPRNRRSLWLSAARSHLFNRVLAHRVALGCWRSVLTGDVLQPEGSRGQFYAEDSEEERARLEAGRLHPTGPLWGRFGRALVAKGAAAEVEYGALAGLEFWQRGLEAQGLELDRRALRMQVLALEWRLEGGELRLAFELGPGCYATAVLRELVTPLPGVPVQSSSG